MESDYEALQERLNTLPDKLSYDIMVGIVFSGTFVFVCLDVGAILMTPKPWLKTWKCLESSCTTTSALFLSCMLLSFFPF